MVNAKHVYLRWCTFSIDPPVAAASAVFIYDFLLTFDREVEQIWRAPWTLMKAAYILQRYLPLFDTVYLTNASLCIILCFRLVILTPTWY
jgi:hypothetical protein